MIKEAGEIAQWLGTLAGLPDDPSLVQYPHQVAHNQAPVTLVPGVPMPSCRYQHSHRLIYVDINKTKIILKIRSLDCRKLWQIVWVSLFEY